MFSSPAFKSTMVAAMQRPPGAVVVDLTGCTFIDSSGLNAIAHANELLDGGTPRVSLVVAHPHLLRLLEITHLQDLLPVYDTRAAALSGHSSSLRVHGNDLHLGQHITTADGQPRDTDVATLTTGSSATARHARRRSVGTGGSAGYRRRRRGARGWRAPRTSPHRSVAIAAIATGLLVAFDPARGSRSRSTSAASSSSQSASAGTRATVDAGTARPAGSRRSGVGVEPTKPWVTRPDRL